jgi:hypothetical protein
MEIWAEIRRRVLVDGLSKRAGCREYSIHWDALKKILEHAELPDYRRGVPRPRPNLPEAIRAGILAMVKVAPGSRSDRGAKAIGCEEGEV